MTILAVDVGGTNVKAGVVQDGTVIKTSVLDARGASGATQMLDRLVPFLGELLTASAVPTSECSGVGIALPTLVDSRKTSVLADMQGKFEGLKDIDVAEWCQREMKMPLRIENDAHAALLGEWRFGSGRDAEDLVMITLGTGIGVSVILGGKPLRGTHSQTGNLGSHLVMQPDGPRCACGGRGCAESLHYISTVNRLARDDDRFSSSALAASDQFTYADLFRLAPSDKLAESLLKRSMDIWGALCVSLIHAFDPTRVILGGGVMRSASVILPHVQGWAKRACTPWGEVEVVTGGLGDAAALLGMASMFENPPSFI